MTHLVLVGGGHAHALALRGLALDPEPGLRITLVAPERYSPYSGMLPGHIAGLYGFEAMHIDLERLAKAAGADFVRARATGFHGADKRIALDNGENLSFDIASIDIGITPDLDAIDGSRTHALAVKPIGSLIPKLEGLIAQAQHPDGPRRVLVIGGGAAGTCLAFALLHRLRRESDGRVIDVALATAQEITPEINAAARFFLRRSLRRVGITVHEHSRIARIDANGARTVDGRDLTADAVLVASHAQAPAVLAEGDLARTPDGFLAIGEDLRVRGQDAVFAVGDCATMTAHPRPKAGVFAVRQGPALRRNIRALVRGEALSPHIPQKDWLMLIATGDGSAIASRGGSFAFAGRLPWLVKDRIDRKFMALFDHDALPTKS
ncbi:MAG: selenide water dikinase SelD [Saliniramus fredricksonii]|uniref:Pyridine nucleotide-disulfide oxidoreductase family protein n=1 Tax=Saliniramus fredricksonii TaxID=1653334 RepID=A0A0P7Y5G8_9HYPH|nr:FAD-dependent oxidoreductase [Saliniramus fredricksonii]KPQ12353.1 MAG: selenide water dikinase SelD [Saliniramus fredricksonii]SCC81255.1 pyridine nucleotide-disulfide oxidoreductase family protein [Saliniramus fredricksonii]